MQAELVDTERYQDAYYRLYDEVGTLIARNELAEEEAQRLSKFNAEILGHKNPAQRILYVDRIRQELAQTKQVRYERFRKEILVFDSFSRWAETSDVHSRPRSGCRRRE
jgi:hypothetical protein